MDKQLSNIQFLTVKEVATLLRVSAMTVIRLIAAEELAAVKVGRAYRIHEQSVKVYLGQEQQEPPAS